MVERRCPFYTLVPLGMHHIRHLQMQSAEYECEYEYGVYINIAEGMKYKYYNFVHLDLHMYSLTFIPLQISSIS